MARTTLVLSLVLFVGTAHAEQPLVSLKQLLNVHDPALAPGARHRLAQVSKDEGASKPSDKPADSATRQVDEETPAALLPQPAPNPADEALAKAAAQPVEDDEDDGSVFKTWWFWALSAVVVGGTVALGVWAAQPDDKAAGLCSPTAIACFGDGR